jgi:hypothetical protein
MENRDQQWSGLPRARRGSGAAPAVREALERRAQTRELLQEARALLKQFR